MFMKNIADSCALQQNVSARQQRAVFGVLQLFSCCYVFHQRKSKIQRRTQVQSVPNYTTVGLIFVVFNENNMSLVT